MVARWGRMRLDPSRSSHALREPAAIVAGGVAVNRAGLDGAARSLELAKEAADFLLWAQQRAGTGVFPFPATRGVRRDNAFVAAERYIARAQQEGRLDEVVRNGWAVNDDGDGGLQFDNGECGVALLELCEFTSDKRCLDAARKAADWSLGRPLVSNWNYNSFSVSLLARFYRVTREKPCLEGAIRKALLGVIPGQLTDEPNAGRWNDPHNARPAHHYLLLRGLAELAAAMPRDGTSRATVMSSLRLGLENRNRDLLERGASNKDKAIEVLLFVNREFANDAPFLRDTLSAATLGALARLV